ncbi:MAG: hypothetical protein ACLSVD_16865 [Eggerthellaceae bacterium]
MAVTARIDADGRVTPLEITWRDGRTFEVDRVSMPCGGLPARRRHGHAYLVSVNGREKYLFHEEPRWFVEVVPDDPNR